MTSHVIPIRVPASHFDGGPKTSVVLLFVVSSSGEVRRGEGGEQIVEDDDERRERTREKLRKLLADGKLEDREVEIEVTQQAFPAFDMMAFPQGMEGTDVNFTEMLQDNYSR